MKMIASMSRGIAQKQSTTHLKSGIMKNQKTTSRAPKEKLAQINILYFDLCFSSTISVIKIKPRLNGPVNPKVISHIPITLNSKISLNDNIQLPIIANINPPTISTFDLRKSPTSDTKRKPTSCPEQNRVMMRSVDEVQLGQRQSPNLFENDFMQGSSGMYIFRCSRGSSQIISQH